MPNAIGCYEEDRQVLIIQNKMTPEIWQRERMGVSCIGENVLEQVTLTWNSK